MLCHCESLCTYFRNEIFSQTRDTQTHMMCANRVRMYGMSVVRSANNVNHVPKKKRNNRNERHTQNM